MGTQYSHLSETDRVRIEVLLRHGVSAAAIARFIGVHRCTVSREIQRARRGHWRAYNAHFGQLARQLGRRRAGLARRKLGPELDTPLWQHVHAGLRAGWSPEQIAGRLKIVPDLLDPSSSRPDFYVAHETIYCAIYAMPRGALRTELVKLLRKSRSGRRHRAKGRARFTGVQNMTPIALRPPEVAARIVPGHWEGDLIKGARNASAVGTLVERTSRYVMLARLDSACADSALDGFTRRLRTVPISLRKTVTYDQGTEMAQHQTLAKRLHLDVFFCDPHSPWQRGSNENANGLIRQYLPKGLDLTPVTDRDLRAIEYALNNRPRKILGFKTPHEVFSRLSLNDVAGVALQA
jgi:IS30 family transposase